MKSLLQIYLVIFLFNAVSALASDGAVLIPSVSCQFKKKKKLFRNRDIGHFIPLREVRSWIAEGTMEFPNEFVFKADGKKFRLTISEKKEDGTISATRIHDFSNEDGGIHFKPQARGQYIGICDFHSNDLWEPTDKYTIFRVEEYEEQIIDFTSRYVTDDIRRLIDTDEAHPLKKIAPIRFLIEKYKTWGCYDELLPLYAELLALDLDRLILKKDFDNMIDTIETSGLFLNRLEAYKRFLSFNTQAYWTRQLFKYLHYKLDLSNKRQRSELIAIGETLLKNNSLRGRSGIKFLDTFISLLKNGKNHTYIVLGPLEELASLLKEDGQTDRYLQVSEEIMKLNPPYNMALAKSLIPYYEARRNILKLVEMYLRILNSEELSLTETKDVLAQLAIYYEHTGQADKAIICYELILKLVRTIKEEKEALWDFANFYSRQGNREKVMDYSDRYLAIDARKFDVEDPSKKQK